ncbi:efflux RND transporter permease subunit [Phenylobacterium sp. Root700]|uniref:efflux RND transporter permease subunit n=1 Tax=Phenylobacterium sp. Root700 TaxID=1736591 RepID=UPI0006FDA7FB|nr:efflux RND transporter permease subunit [Phenylobacterium sp. Root700]KRB40956.1 multidrug transporter [Phenylobacterium sp. Root700]
MKFPNLSALAVRNPSVTLFLIIAILAAGAFAFLKLGRAEDPTFTIKVMTVTAVWPGATAQEMQDQVADRLEKRLQELRYYDRTETQARPGVVSMTVSLKDSTPPGAVPEEFYQARKKLGDEAINLPQGVIGPIINDEFSDVYFGLFALQARGMSHRDLVQEAETLRERLLSVEGVKKVKIIGEQPQRIFVELSYKRLATLGLTSDQLIAALSQQNLLSGDAEVQTGAQSVNIRVDGAFDGVETVRATPISAGGRSFRLGDIAEVRRGYEDPATYLVRHNGAPALVLGVVMRERWNGTVLGESLKDEVAEIRESLPVGLTLTQVADQSKNIEEAYGEFMLKFVVALAVVMVVSLIALGFRVGLVVAAAVPLTLSAVFVIMLMTGRDFDRITLGALILSLGLLVDDAIIAIEMMVVKMQEGIDRTAAATFAWGATAGPMLTGTLVTVIGFIPVGFAQSVAGEYAGNIFWIVAFALLVSWIVAVFFTPYLGVKLLPAIKPVPGGHDAIYATARYARLRSWIAGSVALRGPVSIAVLTALMIAGALLAVVVPKQFFPMSDRPEVLVEVSLPKGTSITATQAVVERIEADLRKLPEARSIDSYIGAGAPRFFMSLNPELPDPAFAKLIVLTDDHKARDALSHALAKRINAGAYPEARVRVNTLLFGPPVPYPVAFRVSGPDPERLRILAAQAADIVRADPRTRDVNLDWGERAPVVRLVFDEDRLRQIGLSPASVSRQVSALISGATVSQMRSGDRTVNVVVRAAADERAGLAGLENMTITTADGRSVPLSGVARLTPQFEDPILLRRDRQPTITVRADIVPGVQPPVVTAAILKQMGEFTAALPPGYKMATGGSVEESAKANAALAPIFPLMIVLMLTVIMVQTRSFKMTGLVFATAPLGLIGAVPALLITGTSFGFNAILGLIGLAGILMRNTLILVDQIEAERAHGLSQTDAVIEATVRRARPVLLTAVAAVLAFLPLTLSSFWGALAVVLIGGTLVGTALTLLFLPALYALWFSERPRKAQSRPETHGPVDLRPL